MFCEDGTESCETSANKIQMPGEHLNLKKQNIIILLRHDAAYRYTGDSINPLTPNVNYSGRTAPLTSKVAFYIFIQQI